MILLFFAIENSAITCTVTKEQKEKVEKLFPEKEIIHIANGIELSEWSPHKSELGQAVKWKLENVTPGKRVVGLFGHLKPKKGLDFFINSIVLSGLQNKIFLLISGETNETVEKKLKSAQIEFFISPFLDRFELLAWYPVCDAVAVPSFYDGMPNVILEAAALSIPIIASNVGGMKDMLVNGKHGFTFHPVDEQSCALAITDFFQKTENELFQMGQNGKKLIEDFYTAKIEAGNYYKIFTQVLT